MNKLTIITSWDDGHILDLKMADLLRKYKIPGIFYISPENREFNKRDLLTNDQIRKLSKDFEIGAHTMTHPRLTKVDEVESKYEIKESKKYLEKIIGKSVISFCYPGGFYNPVHVKQVIDAGFNNARTTKRFNTNVNTNKFEVVTSIHAYQHWSDIMKIARFANYNPTKFINYYLNWDDLALAYFDKVKRTGGTFHLWGHSWEIEKNNDWGKLEKVLKYIHHGGDV